MNLNKVLIVGRLTVDPELRTTPAGQSVASLSVATNRVWTDRSGKRQEETEYHQVVVWAKQAEIASQFLKKGSTVLIEGRLRTRTWQDKQGQSRKSTEIICERLQLGPRQTGAPREQNEKTEKSQESPKEEMPVIDLEESQGEIKPEDLPF